MSEKQLASNSTNRASQPSDLAKYRKHLSELILRKTHRTRSTHSTSSEETCGEQQSPESLSEDVEQSLTVDSTSIVASTYFQKIYPFIRLDNVGDAGDNYRGIWYRHTGDDIPSENSKELPHRLTNKDNLKELGENYITHMIVRDLPIPDLSQVAPKLTHLTLHCLPKDSFPLRQRIQRRKYANESFFASVNVFAEKSDEESTVKATTYRSQRKNEKLLKVTDAHCSCKAGAGGECAHVLGLVLKLTDWLTSGLQEVPREPACTSKPQEWDMPRRRKIIAEPVSSMIISSPVNEDRKKRPLTADITDNIKYKIEKK
ncbi:uncharacterized protein [Watersipora subatra]|uniref:uncharacterized protein n=1 Tax=Watersipora subatra TaxID=2589382 RepID=UPI00355B050C